MQQKICTKCKKTSPATLEFFYKNAGGKFGITPRCKSCVNQDNLISHKKRMNKDPDRVRELANIRSAKHYHGNLKNSRRMARESAARARADPIRSEIIKARKRAGYAGLSPEEIEDIRKSQNNMCAICTELDPTDLDHCHKSGEVRWLLCNHCNRGLGAFKDDPKLLEKAAKMLLSLTG